MVQSWISTNGGGGPNSQTWNTIPSPLPLPPHPKSMIVWKTDFKYPNYTYIRLPLETVKWDFHFKWNIFLFFNDSFPIQSDLPDLCSSYRLGNIHTPLYYFFFISHTVKDPSPTSWKIQNEKMCITLIYLFPFYHIIYCLWKTLSFFLLRKDE